MYVLVNTINIQVFNLVKASYPVLDIQPLHSFWHALAVSFRWFWVLNQLTSTYLLAYPWFYLGSYHWEAGKLPISGCQSEIQRLLWSPGCGSWCQWVRDHQGLQEAGSEAPPWQEHEQDERLKAVGWPCSERVAFHPTRDGTIHIQSFEDDAILHWSIFILLDHFQQVKPGSFTGVGFHVFWILWVLSKEAAGGGRVQMYRGSVRSPDWPREEEELWPVR